MVINDPASCTSSKIPFIIGIRPRKGKEPDSAEYSPPAAIYSMIGLKNASGNLPRFQIIEKRGFSPPNDARSSRAVALHPSFICNYFPFI